MRSMCLRVRPVLHASYALCFKVLLGGSLVLCQVSGNLGLALQARLDLCLKHCLELVQLRREPPVALLNLLHHPLLVLLKLLLQLHHAQVQRINVGLQLCRALAQPSLHTLLKALHL